MRKASFLAVVGAGALSACSTTAPQGLSPMAVMAVGETQPVGTMNEDAADDPAIWRNSDDPSQSLIVATDKKAGLYVYGLDGQVRSFLNAGAVNNVSVISRREHGVIVAASDRNDLANAAIALFRLDTDTAQLEPLGKINTGPGEAYGLCLYSPPVSVFPGELFQAFAVHKDGTIQHVIVRDDWQGEVVRTISVPSQAEGCVVDHSRADLYVGEENAGIWRFDASADSAEAGELLAPIDNRYLVADVEGLAIGRSADGAYLIASSQGDNAYAVFGLPDMTPLGRFRIAEGALGATEETDGIELDTGSFGSAYPEGLFIAQDGQNGASAQNFKLVSWADVKSALGLD